MSVLQTEYDFTLPKGYLDESGTLHREGHMRLATAADEILPMKDPRVQQNAAYMSVILLSRVVTGLGSIPMISTKVIENLYSSDFAFLQDLYNRINQSEPNIAKIMCPKCQNSIEIEVPSTGG